MAVLLEGFVALRGEQASSPAPFRVQSRPGAPQARPRLPRVVGLPPLLPRGSLRLVVRAVAHRDHHDQVLSGVDELADGSLVLHYAPEEEADTPEVEKELVSFLTKPAAGKKRPVPAEVLEDVLGHPYHGTSSSSFALPSFMKGVLRPASQNGATSAPTAREPKSAATTGATPKARESSPTATMSSDKSRTPAPAPAAATATAPSPTSALRSAPASTPKSAAPEPPNTLALASSSVSPSEPKAEMVRKGGEGFDAVRATAVFLVATITTAILRALASVFGVGRSIPPRSPMGVVLTLGVLLATYFFYWFSGFAVEGSDDAAGAPA